MPKGRKALYNHLQRKVVSMYVNKNLSAREISRKLSICDMSVGRLLKRAGVKTRTKEEALRIKYPNGRWGKDAANWRGGKRTNFAGYILAYAPDHPNASVNGSVMEHRLVVEKKLGRYLEKNEVVHHKNGNKSDNRISNLEVIRKGKHTSNHFADGMKARKLERENRKLREKIRRLESQLKERTAS